MALTVDTTATSATMSWSSHGVSGNVVLDYNVEVFRSSESAGNLVFSSYGISSSARSQSISGLSSGTTYVFKLYSNRQLGDKVVERVTTATGTARPSNFSWTIPKVRGNSYSIVSGKVTNLVSRSEIVAFENRINDFREYKGLSAYTFSSKSVGQSVDTAMYNSWKNAITAMSPPTSPSTSTNLIDLLNGLRNSLNSIQ